METYYNELVELYAQTCSIDDYGDKSKVRKHNRAYTKINKIRDKLIASDSEEIVKSLLDCDNENIRIFATTICSQKNILREKSIETLLSIMGNSENKISVFNAKICLRNNYNMQI